MTQKMVNILWRGWRAQLWTCWASDDCGKSKCRWCSVSDWTYSFGVQETDLDRNCRNGSHWVRMLRESVRESERKWHEVEGTPRNTNWFEEGLRKRRTPRNFWESKKIMWCHGSPEKAFQWGDGQNGKCCQILAKVTKETLKGLWMISDQT